MISHKLYKLPLVEQIIQRWSFAFLFWGSIIITYGFFLTGNLDNETKDGFHFSQHNVLWYFWNLSFPDVNDFIEFNLVFVFIKPNFMTKHKSSHHSPETPPRGRQSCCLGPLHNIPLTTISPYSTPSKRWEKMPCIKLPWQSSMKCQPILRTFSERTLLKFHLR